MQCEMCGSKKAVYKVNVEGAHLNLCKDCSGYGKIIKKIKIKPKVAKKPTTKQESYFVIVNDFSKRIKRARENKGMKQEELAKKLNEKSSLISKIETGSLEPSIRLARKLESFLGLSLVEEQKKQRVVKKHEDTVTTIGDLIKIK